MNPRAAPGWLGFWFLLAFATSASIPAHAGPRDQRRLERLRSTLGELESRLDELERAATGDDAASADELAEKLVRGQLLLAEGDFERAALAFFELRENHGGSDAAAQASYYLGVALARLGLVKWSVESFSANLRDESPQGRALHQRSLARLLELASPSVDARRAELPTLTATPERRARLRALGGHLESTSPPSKLESEDIRRISRWVEGIADDALSPELRYAYGHFAFKSGAYAEASSTLIELIPDERALDGSDAIGRVSLRAAYLWAAAQLELGDEEAALVGFDRVCAYNPTDSANERVVEMAWLAMGRLHYDAGRGQAAVVAYGGISRSSPLYPEALYETAWSLLAAGRHAAALDALEVLEIYIEDADFVAEVQQLRGKVAIAQRDWSGARETFTGLESDFRERVQAVRATALTTEGALDYYGAVTDDELQQFTLDALVPVSALSVARALPRAAQTEQLAQDFGALDRELLQLRELLARMEDAVLADERTLLFTDLAAHMSNLDATALEIVELREMILARQSRGLFDAQWRALQKQALRLRKTVDTPDVEGGSRGAVMREVDELGELIQRNGLVVDGMKAQLIAIEREYARTRGQQKIDAQGFLNQAASMRAELREAKTDARRLRAEVIELRGSLRYTDPWAAARRDALADYVDSLDQGWAFLSKRSRAGDFRRIWQRSAQLLARLEPLRTTLRAEATRRLQRAWIVLAAEKRNLQRYRAQMNAQRRVVSELVAEVVAATIPDVIDELEHWVIRSEVGKLDVEQAIADVEVEIMRSLESRRSTDLREIDRLLGERGRERQP